MTEEEREKLDGSYKVAKKLEKLQSKRQDQQQNSLGGTSDDVNYGNESPTADGESRSLDSQGSSEKTSPETSLIGSNGMIDQIDGVRLHIDHFCIILFFILGCPLSPSSSVRSPYSSLSLTASMQLVDEILSDQRIEKMDKIERLEAILSAATASSPSSITLSSSELSSSCCNCDCHSTTKYVLQRDSLPGRYVAEVGCQTLSTGDIVITKVYFPEGDTSASDICLTPSPKKTKPAQFQ